MPILLLPPSETKRSASAGPKLVLESLANPQLSQARTKIIAELIRVSAGSKTRACQILKLGPTQDWELERNCQLLTAPTAPAWQIYEGVLYDAAELSTLTVTQRDKLCDMTYVQSALYGPISLGDRIAAYRLSGDCQLPKLGSVTSFWNKACGSDFFDGSQLIIDLRSGTYVKHLKLPADANVVVPKVLQHMSSGPPKVVSHHNKATKGLILRAIAQAKKKIDSAESLAQVASSIGADVELKSAASNSNQQILEVIID
ncbi:MAG: peroxide stress protein YaaA [Actinomycetales bacterium]|nr:peroxide stress protein YaaA [Actinomycetales bacterium]